MLISSNSIKTLGYRLESERKIVCKGLYLSARWFVLSSTALSGVHFVILPDKESAEYCANDLYSLVEGDKLFFLTKSKKRMERSNYKSSLSIQRTTAVKQLLEASEELKVIVTFPEALEELIPVGSEVLSDSLVIEKGQEISHEQVIAKLGTSGFERVDLVSAPGQFAVRGSLIDFFSYSNNEAYRVSFWGNEVERINIFDCNTQLSKEEVHSAEIISDIICNGEKASRNILDTLDKSAILWLDSSDMYKEREFFPLTGNFARVYLDVPIEKQVKKNTNSTAPKSNKTTSKTGKDNSDTSSTTKTTNTPAGFSENDIKLLSQAVYGEARGEPYVGQVAVAAVILNRLESPSFPNTVSGILFEPLAFTAVADGQIWLEPDETARKAVIDAINGMDPSESATYYFNPETATSKWIWSRPQIKQIGNHIFCK